MHTGSLPIQRKEGTKEKEKEEGKGGEGRKGREEGRKKESLRHSAASGMNERSKRSLFFSPQDNLFYLCLEPSMSKTKVTIL